MKKILVIGSLNIDFSFDVEKIPEPGETVNATNLKISNGGKGANQAYTIGKLGGKVSMLGMVGNDEYGKNIKNSLKKVNVNVKKIILNNKEQTGKAFINVSHDGENAITIMHGANYAMDKDFILKNQNEIKNADIILMQLEIPLKTIKEVIKIAKDKIIIIDPAPADRNLLKLDLSNIFLMKPNETELSVLTGKPIKDEKSIVNAARCLIKTGVKNVVVSLGDKGSYLIDENSYKFYPSIKSKAIDTTAAGDSFIASIALSLANDKTLDESVKFASKVASLVVTKKGAQDSIPSLKEVI